MASLSAVTEEASLTSSTTASSPSTTDNNEGSGMEDVNAKPREGESYRAYRKRRHRETETVRRDRINLSLSSLKAMLGLAAATDHATVLERAVEALETQLAGLLLPSSLDGGSIPTSHAHAASADTADLPHPGLHRTLQQAASSPEPHPGHPPYLCARCGSAASGAFGPVEASPPAYLNPSQRHTPLQLATLSGCSEVGGLDLRGSPLHHLDIFAAGLEDLARIVGPDTAPLSPSFSGVIDLAPYLEVPPGGTASFGAEASPLMSSTALGSELANLDVGAATAASLGLLMDPTLDSHYLSNRTGLFIVACSLHILDCNHALATLLGTTRGYLLGKRATELGIKGENPVTRAALVELMTGQKRTFITVEHARKVAPPNAMHWIRCTVVALADGPQGMCQFIGIMEGVDEPLDGERVVAL